MNDIKTRTMYHLENWTVSLNDVVINESMNVTILKDPLMEYPYGVNVDPALVCQRFPLLDKRPNITEHAITTALLLDQIQEEVIFSMANSKRKTVQLYTKKYGGFIYNIQQAFRDECEGLDVELTR